MEGKEYRMRSKRFASLQQEKGILAVVYRLNWSPNCQLFLTFLIHLISIWKRGSDFSSRNLIGPQKTRVLVNKNLQILLKWFLIVDLKRYLTSQIYKIMFYQIFIGKECCLLIIRYLLSNILDILLFILLMFVFLVRKCCRESFLSTDILLVLIATRREWKRPRVSSPRSLVQEINTFYSCCN